MVTDKIRQKTVPLPLARATPNTPLLRKIDWVNPVFSFFEALRYSLNPAQ
jgi:hypothetical protein